MKVVVKSGRRLVDCYFQQQKFEEAEKLLLLLVEDSQKTLGANNVDSADIMIVLMKFYRSQKQFAKAGAVCKQVLDLYTASFGAADQRTVRIQADYDALLRSIIG